ncbi:MAG: phosphatidylinositol 4-kinase, partial [Oscillospiraceae bacterium]|nr:phosphatidylinositol 4-kinase [Oscillospiraceae bacterium]
PGVRGDRIMIVSRDNLEQCRQIQQQMKESAQASNNDLPPIYKAEIVDSSDPTLQVASMKLAVLDYIGGHFDRHPGNFFISKGDDGRFKITGIDNDSAFAPPNTGAKEPTPESLIRVITPEIRELIRNIDPDRTVNALKGVIDRTAKGQESLDAVRDRIEKLKEHVKDMVPVPEDRLNAETAKKMTAITHGSYGDPLKEASAYSRKAIGNAKLHLADEAREKAKAAKPPENEKAESAKKEGTAAAQKTAK